MAIKGIFFDAGDVLYLRPEPTIDYVSNLLKEKGLSAELPGEGQVRQKALRSRASNGYLSPDEYWDQFLLMHGAAIPEERRTLIGQIIDYSNNAATWSSQWVCSAGI